MKFNGELKIVARGLQPPGPLLIVKKRISETDAKFIRIIVTSEEAAAELIDYFTGHGGKAEMDRAGDDIHVIADLKNFKDVD